MEVSGLRILPHLGAVPKSKGFNIAGNSLMKITAVCLATIRGPEIVLNHCKITNAEQVLWQRSLTQSGTDHLIVVKLTMFSRMGCAETVV
jgi:hypothetical protein